MTDGDLVLGIDVGTSGVRIAALDMRSHVVAMATAAMPAPERDGASITQDAQVWWRATQTALRALGAQVALSRVGALSVDGTSGTLVAIDAAGVPLAPARMYNDQCAAATAARIKALAPPQSAAHGATSALGRALELQAWRPHRVAHQADWIAGHFSGDFGVSDENNALKTGYDPVTRRWPEWIAEAGMDPALLPQVIAAGAVAARSLGAAAQALGLPADALVVAGTTDGCAAFLATGADQAGDAVTSLGSTLVLKLMADKPMFAPESGIYSHRLGDRWLAGGASNSGGAALLAFFTPARIAALEPRLDPDNPTGLDYYPLPAPGERFPINDPALQPRMTPRPGDDARFLQGLLEGIAAVEALGYRRLAEIGGAPLASLRTVGGGARNAAWTRIRARLTGVPMLAAASEDAAVGTARLALAALKRSL